MLKRLKTLIHRIFNLKHVFTILEEHGLFNWMPDKMFLKSKYYCRMGKRLNLCKPTEFNEKLQWLKIHDRRPEYTQMVDKISAKKYVSDAIGEEYIIPTLNVWDSPDDIDFDKLPEKFVLKCNHDSGSVVVCKDKNKLDKAATIRKLKKSLKKNAYWYGREWPYRDVKPKVFAEAMLSANENGLTDYKVHNFNGEPKFILVCKDRYNESGLTEDFFSCDWEHLDVSRPGVANSSEAIAKPTQLEEMLLISKKLSDGIPFLRTDFYIVNDKIYFGELTFFPQSGFKPFVPCEWDGKFGRLLDLHGIRE